MHKMPFTAKNVNEAWNIFSNQISQKYNIAKDEYFWQNFIKNINGIESEEIEYGAYYSALNKKSEDALCLYEYIVYEKGGVESKKIISPYATDASVINLAMIYNSLGKTKTALDLYAKVSGRCSDLSVKSLVMYRMALIYFAQNDIKNARTTAEYAVTLDPRNMNARMLLSKITNR